MNIKLLFLSLSLLSSSGFAQFRGGMYGHVTQAYEESVENRYEYNGRFGSYGIPRIIKAEDRINTIQEVHYIHCATYLLGRYKVRAEFNKKRYQQGLNHFCRILKNVNLTAQELTPEQDKFLDGHPELRIQHDMTRLLPYATRYQSSYNVSDNKRDIINALRAEIDEVMLSQYQLNKYVSIEEDQVSRDEKGERRYNFVDKLVYYCGSSKGLDESLKNKYNEIITISEKSSAEARIDSMIEDIEANCLDKNFKNYSRKWLGIVKRRGQHIELLRMKKYVAKSFHYEEPKEALKRMNELSKSLGKNVNYFDYYVFNRMGAKKRQERIKTSCTKIDNRVGESKTRFSQHDTSFCASFVASELITHKINKKASPLDVVRTYYGDPITSFFQNIFNISETDLAIGIMPYVLEKIEQKGVCLDKDLPVGNITSYDDITANFQIDLRDLNKNQVSCYDEGTYDKIFPNLTPEKVLEIFNRSDMGNIWDNLIKENCDGKREKLNYEVKNKYSLSFGSLKLDIDRELTEGNILALLVDSSFTHDKYYLSNIPIPNHYVSIVGRRYNDSLDRCEYLYRNPALDCYTHNRPGFSCDGDSFWISEGDLAGNILGVTWIEDKED